VGIPGHDGFRPSSFEKDIKVGSFEKSLTVHDLRAIQEVLNQKRQSTTPTGSGKPSPQTSQLEPVHHDEPPPLSEEDFSRTETSDDGSEDEFFECNDEIISSSPSASGMNSIYSAHLVSCYGSIEEFFDLNHVLKILLHLPSSKRY
jgi:hypothetical protein